MIQGDVCLHTFKSPDKRRPVSILTRSSAIPDLNWITIAPITTTITHLSDERMQEVFEAIKAAFGFGK